MNLENVIQRDTRANQPLATTVPSGTLYFVTNEGVLERSNGIAWQTYSSVSSGSNGQPSIFLLPSQDGEDGWPGPPGAAGASGGGGTSDWTVNISKLADQDTTSTTVISDTELLFTIVGSAEVWYIELIAVYAGSGTAVDMNMTATFPTGVGIYETLNITSADAPNLASSRLNGVTQLGGLVVGTGAALTAYNLLKFTIMLAFSASGTFQVKFNANAAGTVRMAAGSILRGKKLR